MERIKQELQEHLPIGSISEVKRRQKRKCKTDLNVGVDNQRIGVTGNVGYDTKGRNVRGGLGLRVIF